LLIKAFIGKSKINKTFDELGPCSALSGKIWSNLHADLSGRLLFSSASEYFHWNGREVVPGVLATLPVSQNCALCGGANLISFFTMIYS
jgi:hypothetical protein